MPKSGVSQGDPSGDLTNPIAGTGVRWERSAVAADLAGDQRVAETPDVGGSRAQYWSYRSKMGQLKWPNNTINWFYPRCNIALTSVVKEGSITSWTFIGRKLWRPSLAGTVRSCSDSRHEANLWGRKGNRERLCGEAIGYLSLWQGMLDFAVRFRSWSSKIRRLMCQGWSTYDSSLKNEYQETKSWSRKSWLGDWRKEDDFINDRLITDSFTYNLSVSGRVRSNSKWWSDLPRVKQMLWSFSQVRLAKGYLRQDGMIQLFRGVNQSWEGICFGGASSRNLQSTEERLGLFGCRPTEDQ